MLFMLYNYFNLVYREGTATKDPLVLNEVDSSVAMIPDQHCSLETECVDMLPDNVSVLDNSLPDHDHDTALTGQGAESVILNPVEPSDQNRNHHSNNRHSSVQDHHPPAINYVSSSFTPLPLVNAINTQCNIIPQETVSVPMGLPRNVLGDVISSTIHASNQLVSPAVMNNVPSSTSSFVIINPPIITPGIQLVHIPKYYPAW